MARMDFLGLMELSTELARSSFSNHGTLSTGTHNGHCVSRWGSVRLRLGSEWLAKSRENQRVGRQLSQVPFPLEHLPQHNFSTVLARWSGEEVLLLACESTM